MQRVRVDPGTRKRKRRDWRLRACLTLLVLGSVNGNGKVRSDEGVSK